MKSLMKKILSFILVQYTIATVFFLYLKFVSITTRWTYIGTEKIPDTDKLIIISWHNRILMTTKLWAGKRNVNFIVSPSKEGQILSYFLRLFGGNPYVGSSGSNTGGNPIQSAVKLLQENKIFSIAPDGSRGPRYHMKPGVAFLMHKTNTDCMITTYNIKNRIILSSWDNMILPLPFSTGVVMYDIVKKHNDDMSAKELQNNTTKDLEESLIALTQKSDKYFNHQPIQKA